MFIIFIILSIIFIFWFVAYFFKKPIMQHWPWLWKNIGMPLRDYLLVTSVRKITLAYFGLVTGLSVSIPWRRITAFMHSGKTDVLLSFEFDDSALDLYICIAIVVVSFGYYIFMRYETVKLAVGDITWIDRLMNSSEECNRLLGLIACVKRDCIVVFSDGTSEHVIQPKFRQEYYRAIGDMEPKQPEPIDMSNTSTVVKHIVSGSLSSSYMQSLAEQRLETVRPAKISLVIDKINKSFAPIDVALSCTNRDPLDNVYLQIRADRDDIIIVDDNKDLGAANTDLFDFESRIKNRRIHDNTVSVKIPTINGGMEYNIRTFYIKAPYDCVDFYLLWNINARSYQNEGKLHVVVNPDYVPVYRKTPNNEEFIEYKDYVVDITRE